MRVVQEEDFTLQNDELQLVEIVLGEGETVIAESGTLMYMEQGVFHEVLESGNMGVSSKWQFQNRDYKRRKIAFSTPYPGKVLPIDLRRYGNRIVCQSNAFLCSAKGVSIQISLHKKFGTGEYDQQSLVMENLKGDGMVFLRTTGPIISKTLVSGEVLRVDSRCLVAVTHSVDFNIQKIGASESNQQDLFFTSLSGPGMVWLQPMPSEVC